MNCCKYDYNRKIKRRVCIYIYIDRDRDCVCKNHFQTALKIKDLLKKKKKNLYTRIFTPYLILNSIAAENKQTSKKN